MRTFVNQYTRDEQANLLYRNYQVCWSDCKGVHCGVCEPIRSVKRLLFSAIASHIRASNFRILVA